MAAAVLVKFKVKIFDDPVTLAAFVTKDDSPVNSVVSIITDNSGKYVLFYLIA